jgi:hypothetical protein
MEKVVQMLREAQLRIEKQSAGQTREFFPRSGAHGDVYSIQQVQPRQTRIAAAS